MFRQGKDRGKKDQKTWTVGVTTDLDIVEIFTKQEF